MIGTSEETAHYYSPHMSAVSTVDRTLSRRRWVQLREIVGQSKSGRWRFYRGSELSPRSLCEDHGSRNYRGSVPVGQSRCRRLRCRQTRRRALRHRQASRLPCVLNCADRRRPPQRPSCRRRFCERHASRLLAQVNGAARPVDVSASSVPPCSPSLGTYPPEPSLQLLLGSTPAG